MPSNPIGFKITDSTAGWDSTDFDDVFVRKDCFLEGGLWIWGGGLCGRLGDGTTTGKSSPIQTISGGSNWKQVSNGGYHAAGIKTDGTLWLWGGGVCGRLGNNSTVDRSSPVQTVAGGNDWKQASVMFRHSAAVKTNGTLWMWGSGDYGRLGNHSLADQLSPIETVAGGSNWKQVSLGHFHSSAVKNDGTLWVWGRNAAATIGDNTTINKSSPVQTISGGTNWKQVSAGRCHTAGVKTDGTLWLWGLNDSGQIGNDSLISQSSPVQTISSGTNWKQVSLGCFHSAAIKTDGTLWLWGSNGFGELGTNNSIVRSSPVQTVSGGTNWRQVSISSNGSSSAIKTDGSLWLWGNGETGILGDNTVTNRSSPIQTVSGGTNWRNVDMGCFNTAAIREDCW